MMLNLLHNAVRHTPAGGSVAVGLAMADATLSVEVADTGGGIPVADRERIFERFVRLMRRAARMAARASGWPSPAPSPRHTEERW